MAKLPLTLAPILALTLAVSALDADPATIRLHVRALAGGDGAATYIARQFASYGLKPAGDDATYFQNVPMMEVRTLPETSFSIVSLNLDTLTLANLEEFITSSDSFAESAVIDAPIVFVGYGIRAPEYGWDDYKEAVLDGKVALVMADAPSSGDPEAFTGKAPTDYGGSTYKFEETARRGAIATLIIERPDPAGRSWQALRDSMGGKRFYLRMQAAGPTLRAASWLRFEAARKLIALAGLDPNALLAQAQSKDFRPIEMPLRLQAHVASQLRPIVSKNVLSRLPGRGAFSQEAVLYTTHCDFLGSDAALERRTSAASSGVAEATACGVLLETARAWSQRPSPSPRLILFAALTGEEQGRLGSQYLARHLPVRPGRISIDLNFDPLPPVEGPPEVVVSGAERTTFYALLKQQAQGLGLAIRPDPPGGAEAYYRSTPFSFARVGIPAFSIASGRSPDVEPRAMSFTGAGRLATFGYELGVQASAQPARVAWQRGDAFEAERALNERAEVKPISPRRRGKHPKS